ncbi:putative acyl-CoA dehydrogenase [delta proteobacterium NaphS2]|nr:putative acyl-CoA dehydrogenase [delta proteobacterium NaphS2]
MDFRRKGNVNMDFELNEEQKNISEAARKFALGEFPQIAIEFDREEKFPMDIWKKAVELGFTAIFLDEQYGGLGLGLLEQSLVTEEFWRVDPGVGCVLLSVFGSEVIQDHGTDAQKSKYLPMVTGGEAIFGCAITEANAGSDIFSVRSKAVKKDGGYVLNGSKMFITNGSIADFLLVFCITNPEAKSRYEKYSFLLLDTKTEGFEADKLNGKMGIRASDTASLSFSDVLIPEVNLLGGQEGKGFRQVMECFNFNRIIAGSQGVGVAQGALDLAVKYMKEREQFGKPLTSFQGLQFKLAEMASRVEAARALVRMGAWMIDNGTLDPKIVSIAKLVAGETAVRVTDEALQLHGGYGYMDEYHVERFYRDAKIVEIYEGAKEIEKITVANEILRA